MQSTMELDIIQTAPDAVTAFTDALADFDLDDWLIVASAAEEESPARSTAFAVLQSTIAHLGLAVQAWSVIDDVETVAHCSVNQFSLQASSRKLAVALRAARRAANAAALALLIRPMLNVEDFDVLYRPFASLVSL